MPKKEIDYLKTVMYKFVCNDLNVTDVYVGHTTHFVKRKGSHKSSCYNENDKSHNLKIYQTIRANGDWDNWQMIEIEKYPCNDGNEARLRERYWYEQLNANMNMINPYCSKQEYRQINKEIMYKQTKDYRKINKDALSEKGKITFKCDCDSICRIRDKSRHNKTIKHINFITLNKNNI